MNSIFIGVVAVFLVNQSRGNRHNNNDDLDRVTELYDTIIDLITYQDNDYNCETRLNNLKDLLCDSLEYCYGSDEDCMTKDQFISGASAHCNEYKEVEDFIQITQNSDSYDHSISLSVKLVHSQMDNCQMTKTYDEVVTYNGAGLITKISNPAGAKESLICPYQQPETTDQYAEEPTDNAYGEEQELPPVAQDDFTATDVNTAVIINVLDNDYDPDRPGVSGKQALEIEDFTQGEKGKVEQKGNNLRYKPNKDECGTDTFTYWVTDLDDGLTGSANVYIAIPCPLEDEEESEYVQEEAANDSYGQETASNNYAPSTRKLKNLRVDVAVEDPLYGGYTKVTDADELEDIASDIVELEAQIGKDVADVSLGGAYAKDITETRIRYRCLLEYTDYAPDPVINADGTISQVSGDLSIGYIEYDVVNCNQEKNVKVREWGLGYGDVLCKSKEDKVDDIDQNKFCVDMEYESICHTDGCEMFANKIKGRDSYLKLAKRYENMFDAATMDFGDDVMILHYRKGDCSGIYTVRIEVQYDEENDCISKWTDYMDDVMVTDQDCDNSMVNLFQKLETDCKFDDELELEPATGYNNKTVKIRELNNRMGGALCKSTNDKIDGIKDEFCENMEYEGVCNNYDNCGMFADEAKGRDSFMNLMRQRQYEDVFDEATYNLEDTAILVRYRKGSCAGDYLVKVEIEYDEENNCISKFTEYLDDVLMTDKDCDGSVDKFVLKIKMECQYDDENGNQYGSEPVNEYASQLAPLAHDDYIMIEQNEITQLYVLANDKDPNNPHLSARDTLDINSATNGNKGKVFISPTNKRLRYVPNDGECGDDLFEYTVVNGYGLSDTANVYITINCDNYDEEPVSEYKSLVDEKNEKVRELTDKMSNIACKSKGDTADDMDMKNKFCDNMEYEAKCNDDERCGRFRSEPEGREFFMNIVKQYQDMFDDATVTLKNDSFLVKYRKGLCSGDYRVRVDIEYDARYHCISKYTEHLDDLVISDPDCDDSDDKFINKIRNQCKYDDENDENTTEESVQYESGETTAAPILVKMEREDKLKSFYGAAFSCRLRKNKGNTQLLDKFMGYLSDSSKLCIVKDNGDSETCYGKDEIRSMMADRDADDNELIDYNVDITYNDGNKIEAKCTSRKKRSDGCIVIKEEYDSCLFNGDGSIEEFKLNRSNEETECEGEE